MTTYRRIRRVVMCICMACFGTGIVDMCKCAVCAGTGEVERTIVEIVSEDKVSVC